MTVERFRSSPMPHQYIKRTTVRVLGAYYDLDNGKISFTK